MLLALFLAAAQPWLQMEAGPMFLRNGGGGPLLRVSVGQQFAERLGGELWLTAGLQGPAGGARGDSAVLGGGAGGRVLLRSFGEEGKLGLWARAGVGWSAAAAGNDGQGPSAFGGALLSFQPFMKRFTVGLEADALAFRRNVGFAVLPSLRCSF
ncbi:MAG: hypothetical protein E6J78_09175 [Deltaproteobacteria bacterium]|nr:MAG: hypothetical protein E6J78_09175 [Deltaproteobacteria bacterium]